MKYFEALKIFNQGKSSYCSPKKGTPDHAKVLAIQKGTPPPPSAMPPSATGVVMRKSRKTGSAVKMAVPKKAADADADADGGGGMVGMKMRNTRKKVKIAVPVASRPLPTTQFSQRRPTMPTTQFSSRSGTNNMPTTQFSTRGGGADVLSMSRSGAVSNAPMPRPEPLPSPFVIPTDDNDDKGAGGGIIGSGKPPMPSKARIAELKAKGRALIAQRKADAAAAAAPAGVLGKEAGKMINSAIKGHLARKRMKAAEKQMVFDILTKDTPYIFKNVPKSDVF